MPLSDEKIAELLAKPKRGGGPKKAKPITRDYQGWFDIAHKLIDEDTGELAKCSNENCVDSREGEERKNAVVVEVNGKLMCRFCFLDGWNEVPQEQLVMTE